MLSHEWKELEFVSQRLDRLRQQHAVAARDGCADLGVIDGLRRDVMTTQRRHEQLLAHISQALVASVA